MLRTNDKLGYTVKLPNKCRYGIIIAQKCKSWNQIHFLVFVHSFDLIKQFNWLIQTNQWSNRRHSESFVNNNSISIALRNGHTQTENTSHPNWGVCTGIPAQSPAGSRALLQSWGVSPLAKWPEPAEQTAISNCMHTLHVVPRFPFLSVF